MSVSYDYTGKAVLVTGGTRGIGAGLARAFLAAGAEVSVCARKDPGGLPYIDHDFGRRTAAFSACDVRDPDDVARMIDEVHARHGRLDVVVNNAGGGPYALVDDASPRLHQRVVELNLLAPLHVAQAARRVMAEGSIIMIGSVSGTRPSPGTAAYGAAKAGLHHLAACLAAEWAPDIRVNTLVVGLVSGGDEQEEHYGDAETAAAVHATVPAGRMAVPDDVARACLFLGLEPYVTGASIAVDGGGEQPAWQYIVQQRLVK